MHEMAEIIMLDMAAFVNTRLRGTYGRMITFGFLHQPVSVGLRNVTALDNVGGFQLAGSSWARQEVFVQGTTRVIRTQVPGTFAFNRTSASAALNMPGIETLPNHITLTALINRYNLVEFLGSGSSFNINAPIGLVAIQGVAARLSGAAAGANNQNWLRNQGYIVPARGAAAPAQTQEAVYYVMVIYEIRSGTLVSNLRIADFNALSGITGIDARYRPFIQAAFELNIYNNRNMQPTGSITTGDFLRMISALDSRIGL
jgi:hypothetical protein